jgi:hypothetical protein
MDRSHWYYRPLTITQTVLREIDAVDYDAKKVVAYLQETNSNCLVVNGGGIFDFFRNPLPCANPNPFLGDRDILAEISSACREAGIKVVVRVDFRGVERQHWEPRKDWFAREADGNPMIRTDTSLPLYAPCYESRYRNEHARSFISYLFENYPVDGIWHNAVLCRGVCHCERCRARWAEEEEGTIPIPGKASEREMDRYWDFKARSAHRNLTSLRETVKSFGDDKAYTAEVFSMFRVRSPRETGLDLYDARLFFDFLVSVAFLTENSDRPRWFPLQYAGGLVRFLKSLDPARSPVVLWGGNGTSHRYIMDPPADTRVWLWESVSLGGGFWNCVFNGHSPAETHDRRNAFICSDVYAYIRENADVLDYQVPVADATVLYSRATKDRFGGDEPEDDRYCTAVQGIESVLVDNHIPYGFLIDEDLNRDALQGVRLLVLPNAACLSDEQCEAIRGWVGNGGSLLATYQSSLFDEGGTPRADFGLADLFGCHYSGREADTHKDCYQAVELSDHPILEGIENTELIINGGHTVLSRVDGAEVVCRYVPIIVNQPPERAWREKMAAEEPTIVSSSFGKGKVIYFANQSDRLAFVHGHDDYRRTLANAVRFLARPLSLTTEAPESVHVAYTQKADAPGTRLLSLVNHTSSPGRPLRTIVPVRDITIRLEGRFPNHRILRADGGVTVAVEEKTTVFHVDEIKEFCSILLEG